MTVDRATNEPMHPAGLGAHQFGGVGIALLRHDRGAGGQVVGQSGEAEHRRHPDHDLLGEPRQMTGRDRGGGQALQREVAVRHRVQRIRHRPVEAQVRGRRMAIDGEGRSGQGRGAQRVLVHPLARIGEAAGVAPEHLDIGHQMMTEGHRLGGLQMGEAGHEVARMLFGSR
jgi:hypothetical protein